MNIALAGNPNCGKTTIFNLLTGKRERVGNWSGVTVDSRSAYLRKKFLHHFQNRHGINDDIRIIDLPGTYSLNAYTKDEQHASDYIKNHNIDVIINIVDASNLERNLVLTAELQALNIPMIVALNKADIIERRGTTIDIKKMSELLGTEVFFVTASRSKGVQEIIHAALEKGDLMNNGNKKHKRRYQHRKQRLQENRKRNC